MKKNQTGAAIVEFALVAILFFTVLLAIMDFGRILFIWNSSAEATRLGARMSIVCDQGAPIVLTRIQEFVPITSDNLQIDWYDDEGKLSDSCDHTDCAGVAVSIRGFSIAPISPLAWIGFSSLSVPGFATYLPREIMGQDPESDKVCDPAPPTP